ncbi:MAG: M23 family metallopeptidase [Candidatus Cloacimonetes bacterium]|nr:M23 family metallopeptidase [Candidatus Cloacimonadota bacterium]
MKYFLILLFIALASSIMAEDILTLQGNATQGGILIGKLSSTVEKIFLDYQEIPLMENIFIIGFDRDAKLRHILTLLMQNGQMETTEFHITKREYETQRIDNIPPEFLEDPKDKDVIDRIERESATLQEFRKYIHNNQFIYLDDFTIPIENGEITGVFGCNRILNGIPVSPHNGLDIAAPLGTEIRSMATGIVALTGNYFYNGKFVLIDHGCGLSSIYIHMSNIYVEKGDYIICGDKIGEVGCTGRSTGNHLHWGISWKGERIDPALIIKQNNIFFKLSSIVGTD